MNFTKNVRIGTRQGLAFGVMLLLILSMAGTGFAGAAKLFAETRTIYEDRTVPLGDLASINQLMMTSRVLVMDTIIEPGSLEKNQVRVQANGERIGLLQCLLSPARRHARHHPALQWAKPSCLLLSPGMRQGVSGMLGKAFERSISQA